MYRSPQSGTISRRNFQICRVIIATSLVWFMIDVFLLMYFTDCSSSVVKTEDCSSENKLSQSSVPIAIDSTVLLARRKKETVAVNHGEAIGTKQRVLRGRDFWMTVFIGTLSLPFISIVWNIVILEQKNLFLPVILFMKHSHFSCPLLLFG